LGRHGQNLIVGETLFSAQIPVVENDFIAGTSDEFFRDQATQSPGEVDQFFIRLQEAFDNLQCGGIQLGSNEGIDLVSSDNKIIIAQPPEILS